MIFSSPQVRDSFHRLSTKVQHDIARFEASLADMGVMIVVKEVKDSKVLIEITDSFVASVSVES